MNEGSQRLGYFVSGAMHAGLFCMLVVGFAAAPKFEDASESVPVETVTQSQLNEIMNGEKTGKPLPTPPVPTPPQPPVRPVQEAAVDPTPPEPPQPPPELKRVEEPPPAPEPPPKPVAAPPAPKAAPMPPPKPEVNEAKEAPAPPPKPKPPTPPPPEKPKEPPPEKFKTDALAKLIKESKNPEPPKDAPKDAKPVKAFDPKAIARQLGPTKVADATPTGSTPLGLPNAHASRMSPSLSAALDSWFKDAYMGCWTPPPTLPPGEVYVPEVHVEFNADGSLSGRPVLVNPPTDPAWRPHAESAMRAAMKCNPLKVPAQYAPYFDQWRAKTIHFDPQDAMG